MIVAIYLKAKLISTLVNAGEHSNPSLNSVAMLFLYIPAHLAICHYNS